MISNAWLVGAAIGFIAFTVAFAIGYWRARQEERRRRWYAEHRPCWHCEGPEGARLRIEQHKFIVQDGDRWKMPYAPALGDCDYCRWPPKPPTKATVRR